MTEANARDARPSGSANTRRATRRSVPAADAVFFSGAGVAAVADPPPPTRASALRAGIPARAMLEAMRTGGWFRVDHPAVVSRHLAAADATAAYNATTPRQKQLRRRLLEDLFAHVGPDVDLRAPLHVEHGTQVAVGARTRADHSLTLTDHAPITIGRDVTIGAGVTLLTTDTPVESVPRHAGWATAQPIRIEDGAALGAGVIVLPGVTIGERTVVGAGSVVTRDLPADVVAVGNPARILRTLTDHGSEPSAPDAGDGRE